MANKNKRPWIQDIRSSVGQKMLQDQMDWMWEQLTGKLPVKALSKSLQNTITAKAEATTLEDVAAALEELTAITDGSLTIWYSVNDPAGKETYDIWFRTTPQPYLIQRWMGMAYADISSTATARALIAAYSAQKTADGKIKVYRQTTSPTDLTAADDGDLWFDTDDKNKLWAWNGTTLAWESAQDTHLDETVTQIKTEIIQAANEIRIAAGEATTDDLGEALLTVMASIIVTPGKIDFAVSNIGNAKPNLVLNSTFRQGFEHWTDGDSAFEVLYPADHPTEMFGLPFAYIGMSSIAPTVWHDLYSEAFAVAPNTEYTWSTAISGGIDLNIVELDSAGGVVRYQELGSFTGLGADTRKIVHFTTDATTAKVQLMFRQWGGRNAYFGMVQVEKGATSTPWSPSPNDPSRKVFASIHQTLDENGLVTHHILLDGVTPYEVWSRLYGGGLEIYEESTGDFIGGLTVRGGKVVLSASAISDPREVGGFYISVKGFTELAFIGSSMQNAEFKGLSCVDGEDRQLFMGQFRQDLGGGSYGATNDIVSSGRSLLLQAYSGLSLIAQGKTYTPNPTLPGSVHLRYISPGVWGFFPGHDEINLGDASFRWKKVYSVSSTISTSDAREKSDIHPVDPEMMLRFLMALNIDWFRLNADPNEQMVGVIAQQLREAMTLAGMPEDFGGYVDELADHSHLATRPDQLLGPIISVVQQQQHRIDELERKLNALTNDGK